MFFKTMVGTFCATCTITGHPLSKLYFDLIILQQEPVYESTKISLKSFQKKLKNGFYSKFETNYRVSVAVKNFEQSDLNKTFDYIFRNLIFRKKLLRTPLHWYDYRSARIATTCSNSSFNEVYMKHTRLSSTLIKTFDMSVKSTYPRGKGSIYRLFVFSVTAVTVVKNKMKFFALGNVF